MSSITRHLLAPYQVIDAGIGYDSVNDLLIAACEQNSDSDPFFVAVDPTAFTVTGHDSSAKAHVWSMYEIFVSNVDSSLYFTATKGFGSQFLVRYSLAGVWQWEQNVYYTNFRENPIDNAIWVSVLSGGLYSTNIRNFSRATGATVTTHNVGFEASGTVMDSSGNFYFTTINATAAERKKLRRVNLSTGAVTVLLTHTNELTEIVYDGTNLWLCENGSSWVEFGIAGGALTGRSATMPITNVFGTAVINPSADNQLWGTHWAANSRVMAVDLDAASTLVDFTTSDGLESPGHGTFTSPDSCFFVLDQNPDTGYMDIQEACLDAGGGGGGLPDGDVYWPNPLGLRAQPRGMMAWNWGWTQSLTMSTLYTAPVVVTTPPVRTPAFSKTTLERYTADGLPEIVYQFTYRDFEDSDDEQGIYDPNNH